MVPVEFLNSILCTLSMFSLPDLKHAMGFKVYLELHRFAIKLRFFPYFKGERSTTFSITALEPELLFD